MAGLNGEPNPTRNTIPLFLGRYWKKTSKAALPHNGHCAYAGRLDRITPGWRVRVIVRRLLIESLTCGRRSAAMKQ